MLDEVKGFFVTLRRLAVPNQTVQYPEERRINYPRYRGLPSLRADPESGEALCVACGLCARICPTSCLEMNVVASDEGDRELGEFILRSGRCLFCGMCAMVCPVDAITMSGEFELATMDREGLIYTKTELAAIGAQDETWWGADSDNPGPNKYTPSG